MKNTALIEDVTRKDSPFICRILDACKEEQSLDALYIGTVVLVSDQGGESGYGVTCWHNFDFDFQLGSFDEEKQLHGIWLLPYRTDIMDKSKRRPVTVIGRWSNPIQDFAVLKISRAVIDEFRLQPAHVSFDITPGTPLVVVGFHRPNDLVEPDHISVKVTQTADVFKVRQGGQRVFEVDSTDLNKRIPWDAGMSGGAIFEKKQGVLVGLSSFVAPNETGSHHYRGYGIPLSVVAETWTKLEDYCHVVELSSHSAAVTGKIPFDGLIRRKTRGFVGREWLAARVDGFVDANECGYFEVRGQPGIGKTAFLSWLVQNRGYVHHFNDATQGIVTLRQFIRNFSARLIERFCPGAPEPEANQCQDGAYLQHLLDEVSARLRPDEKAVLIVDGLDEADRPDTMGGNVLALPLALPRGVFILMTRRELDHFPLMLEEPLGSFVLRADSPENLADVRRLLQTTLEHGPWQKRLQEAALTPGAFVDLMMERSEGNFMYLRHVLPALERAGGALELRELPLGLTGYYERHLRQMRGQDPQRWAQVLFPVICVLAAAREPLAVAEITDFVKRGFPEFGHLSKPTVRSIIGEWHEFLDETTFEGQTCFRIYHTSFREFLEQQVIDE